MMRDKLNKLARCTRFRIARLFNRSARYCWADLAAWSVYGGEFPGATADKVYRNCNVPGEICYCGKFDNAPEQPDGPPPF